MRIVIDGDKSKYQFFKFIVGTANMDNSEFYHSEDLCKKKLYVSSDKDEKKHYFSYKVPLNTELYFPEDRYDYDELKDNDRIILFNEFPYNREEDISRIKRLMEEGKAGHLSVVFVTNDRKNLETDVSYTESDLETAEIDMKQMGIHFCEYNIGDSPFFLYRAIEETCFESKIITSMIAEVKNKLGWFEDEYRERYAEEIEASVDFSKGTSIILKYDKTLYNSNVWTLYASRAKKFFFESNSQMEDFYVEIYKDFIRPIAIWDIKRDIEGLKEEVRVCFEKYIKSGEVKMFTGSELDYDYFKNENHIIDDFIKKLKSFFENELRELIKTRVSKSVGIMEGLMNERNN